MSKISKRRFCPAADREIPAAECGENRNSRYNCPASCGFNPFAPANYDQLLEAESRLQALAVPFLDAEPGHGERVRRMQQKGGLEELEIAAFLAHERFLRRDEEGRTLIDRWEQAGFAGLKNDLRCLARFERSMSVRLLETQRVIDQEQIECIDLLDPALAPRIWRDRTTASRACRYDALLVWSYDLPFYSRIIGVGIQFPVWAEWPPEQALIEIVRHLGGPVEKPGLHDWLAGHFFRCCKAVWEVANARQRLAFAAADLRFGQAVYHLTAPYAECRAVLDAQPGVSGDNLDPEARKEGFSEARAWLASENPGAGWSEEVVGTIALGQTAWRLTALGEARLKAFQERFEAALGDRVRFAGSRLDDLRTPQAAEWDKTLVPPRLLENVSPISLSSARTLKNRPGGAEPLEATLSREQDRQFLETQVPALGGMTPREAAKDPNLIPVLKRLLKQRINGADQMNLRTGASYDPRWYLEELGVAGLSLDMPPARPPLEPRPVPSQSADEEPVPRIRRPRAPRLPASLPFEDVEERFRRMMAQFADNAAARREMKAAGCTFLDDVNEWLPDEAPAQIRGTLFFVIQHVWFCMVPEGTFVPEIPLDRLYAALKERMSGFSEAKSVEEQRKALESRFQPQVFIIAFGMASRLLEQLEARGEARSGQFLPVCLVILSTLIDELHLALARSEA